MSPRYWTAVYTLTDSPQSEQIIEALTEQYGVAMQKFEDNETISDGLFSMSCDDEMARVDAIRDIAFDESLTSFMARARIKELLDARFPEGNEG